jgi:hypothetical protein
MKKKLLISQNDYFSAKNQKGFVHVIVIVVLIMGLFAGLYLINNVSHLFSRAFSSLSGPINPPPPVSGPVNPTPTPLPTPTVIPTRVPTPTPLPTPTVGSIIKIYAAGTPAQGVYPTMQLVLAGKIAKSFSNINGNPFVRPFREYTYTIPVPVKITPDQVRVAFTNDYYGGSGQDRNLIVDKINIDGVDYQSEASTVFSTGSWDPANGCSPGKKQTEWLVCNGYLEYR